MVFCGNFYAYVVFAYVRCRFGFKAYAEFSALVKVCGFDLYLLFGFSRNKGMYSKFSYEFLSAVSVTVDT